MKFFYTVKYKKNLNFFIQLSIKNFNFLYSVKNNLILNINLDPFIAYLQNFNSSDAKLFDIV